MKEQIQKLLEVNKSATDLLKEGKVEDAIKKLEESQEVASEVVSKVTEAEKKSEEVAKLANEEVKKLSEKIEKYSSLSVSADALPDLLEQLLAGSQLIKDMQTSIQKIGDTEKGSQQIHDIKKTENVWGD